jgi:hypothetical protein
VNTIRKKARRLGKKTNPSRIMTVQNNNPSTPMYCIPVPEPTLQVKPDKSVPQVKPVSVDLPDYLKSFLKEGSGIDPYFDFVTNEVGTEYTLQVLTDQPVHGNIIIAPGGFFALDAAAVRPTFFPYHILILDPDPRVDMFWKKMAPKIREAKDRNSLITKIKQEFIPECKTKFARDVEARFSSDIHDGRSWLSNDEKFKRIKEIFLNERFAMIRQDIAVSSIISRRLEESDLMVDVIRVSDFGSILSFKNLSYHIYHTIARNLKAQITLPPRTLIVDTDYGTYNSLEGVALGENGYNLRLKQIVYDIEGRVIPFLYLPTKKSKISLEQEKLVAAIQEQKLTFDNIIGEYNKKRSEEALKESSSSKLQMSS